MVTYALNLLRSLWHEDRAQDAFEYLLVIGGVSVAIIFVMATPVGTNLAQALVTAVCGAINTVIEPDVVCPSFAP